MAGPFYFAWADGTEKTFGNEHVREDEHVLSFEVQHAEGDFPTLEIVVENPRVGLLAPGRKRWAWLSFDPNWTGESESESAGEITPLFFGRIVSVPEDLDGEVVKLTFVAKPLDWASQQLAVAATKKVRPYWDPIFFQDETRDDPDNVLESRPELWHIDRTTLEVTTSNVLNGEDGTLEFGESEVLYETVRVSYAGAPVRRVNVVASVQWDQNATGVLDLSYLCNYGAPYAILTYSGAGLMESWPKAGASIGGGWEVSGSFIRRVDGVTSANWGYASNFPVYSTIPLSEHDYRLIVPEYAIEQTVLASHFPAHKLAVPRWRMVAGLGARYNVSRKRSEQLTFSLEADVQAVLAEPGDEDTVNLSFSSGELAAPIDPAGALPIGDPANAVYFSGPRGAQSIEYLIALARARLLAASRVVQIDFEIPWASGIAAELSCRKTVHVVDRRLPGGEAIGKITGYTLTGDGDSGALACSVSIGCAVGKGNAVSAVPGTPTYVAAGYVNAGYQRLEGDLVAPIAGEVLYEDIQGLPPNDDGVDFHHMERGAYASIVKSGDWRAQELAMAAGTEGLTHSGTGGLVVTGPNAPDPNTVFQRLDAVPTTFALTMKPVDGGPFETLFSPEVSQLMVPKGIDLEAPSTP